MDSTQLSEREQQVLGDCIVQICQARKSIGEAFKRIRDMSLYRTQYRNFSEYALHRWDMDPLDAVRLCGTRAVSTREIVHERRRQMSKRRKGAR